MRFWRSSAGKIQLEAGEVPAAPAAAFAEDSPENNADAAVQTEQILEVKPEEAENTSADEGGSISAQKAETVQEEASAVFSVPRQEPNTYWDCNEASFLKMLEENPEEEEMNLLIPGSKWVRIREDDVAYIMGIIYDEDGTPMYLCYGFPEPWSEILRRIWRDTASGSPWIARILMIRDIG